MSRSAEEVLLIVNHVKNKKTEGSLYMMAQRMAWMPQARDSFTISHNYADIRVQKISPDTKDKVQLQIVMHDGGANTYHFCNKKGRDVQKADREGIKELLQQLLPNFRRKVNSELEEKNRMLQDDPELFQLYKDLVVSGVVTSDEFWANRTTQKHAPQTNVGQGVGISAAFLADIKPQTDGCNGLRYNLTADIIESIFRTYPAVQKKHAEYVPDKLSEQDFWTKFFQSHYFHRDRINISSKDLFSECAKHDEQDMRKELDAPKEDPLMDLSEMSDCPTGEGYGSQSGEKVASFNPSNASLLRRFNQHSTMVLKACEKRAAASASATSTLTNGHEAAAPAAATLPRSGSRADLLAVNGAPAEDDPPPAKKAKIREKLLYADLTADEGGAGGPSLRLSQMERYLHGPTPLTASTYTSSQDVLQACRLVSQEVQAWHPRLNQTLQNASALNVLMELSPGGALMQGHTQQQLHQMIPTDTQRELKQHYSALCELLRHYWACYPTTTKQLEEKLLRMRNNLERYQQVKLNPLRERLHNYHYNLNLLGHMDEMLSAAFTKYTTWQNRRRPKKS